MKKHFLWFILTSYWLLGNAQSLFAQDPLEQRIKGDLEQQKQLQRARRSIPWQYQKNPNQRYNSAAPGVISSPFTGGTEQDLYRQPGRRYSNGRHLLNDLENWLKS